jgi:hypothetical protein
MSGRNFDTTMRMIAREAARAERSRVQALSRQQAASIRTLRDAERQAKVDAREAAQFHVASQIEEAEDLSKAVREREEAINGLLVRALGKDPSINLKTTLTSFKAEQFNERQWRSSPPVEDNFTPEPPGFFARLVPGATGRHQHRIVEAKRRFQDASETHLQTRRERDLAFRTFEASEASRKAEIDSHNAAVIEMQRFAVEAMPHTVIGRD